MDEDVIREILKDHNINLKPSNARLVTYPDRFEEVLYPGAHIATGVDGLGNQYHHGIVLDNTGEMNIVHFWGFDKKTAKIQTTTLASFLAGSPDLAGKVARPLYLISYDNDNEQKRRETIERAKNLLKDAHLHKYNLISDNCECLATYSRTGIWASEQVEKVQTAINRLIVKIAPMVKASANSSSSSFWN